MAVIVTVFTVRVRCRLWVISAGLWEGSLDCFGCVAAYLCAAGQSYHSWLLIQAQFDSTLYR